MSPSERTRISSGSPYEIFSRIRPASTMVVVKELLDDRWRVEMEAEAIIGPALG